MLLVTSGCLEISAIRQRTGAAFLTGLGEGNLLTAFDVQAAGLDQITLRAAGPEPLELLVGSGSEFSRGMPALHQYLQERAQGGSFAWQRQAGT
jgi:hypothetical protein